jgi:large subunit ribosomal protein L10
VQQVAKVEQKQVIVNEIKEKLATASSAVLVDAQGLTVEEDTILRKKLREAGVEYKVYKNTMMNFAVEGTQFEGLKAYFAGPSALALSYENPVAAAAAINEAAKNFKALEFKAGVVEGIVYDAAGVKAIAEIPSREVLLSRLLGSFQSPVASFARVIKAIAEKDVPAAE